MNRLFYPIRIWIFKDRMPLAGQVREHIRESLDARSAEVRGVAWFGGEFYTVLTSSSIPRVFAPLSLMWLLVLGAVIVEEKEARIRVGVGLGWPWILFYGLAVFRLEPWGAFSTSLVLCVFAGTTLVPSYKNVVQWVRYLLA